MLARAAENAGAKVYRAAQPISIEKAPNDGWRAEIASGGDRQQWRARFVVDATGRTSAFARKQGAIRTSYDHLVAAVAFFTPQLGGHASDSFTVVEAVENGWWYSASLPDRRRVVAFMTDADLYAQGCRTSNDYWLEQLLRTEHTKSRLDARALDAEPRVFPANSSGLDGMAGTNWLAVGDAAMAFDPLSSQGVCHALKSGIQAAQSIHRQISGDEGTRLEYVAWLEETFDRYVALRSYYYRKEQRWPASLFWIRRHAAVVARKASVLTS
jgi:flavin-dependent dehydrogenase